MAVPNVNIIVRSEEHLPRVSGKFLAAALRAALKPFILTHIVIQDTYPRSFPFQLGTYKMPAGRATHFELR